MKNMTKICTSIEQSKKLIELGIDRNTADMCYKCLGEDPYDLIVRPYSDWKEEYKVLLKSGDAKVYPAWSLTALLKLIPKSIISTPNPLSTNYCCRNVEFDMEFYADNPVDAVFTMVCWLLENKKL